MPTPAPTLEEAVRDLGILDTPPEAEFDALVRVASLACDVPVALFSLADAQRHWFKAHVGLPGVPETARDIAFCTHVLLQDDLMEIPDTISDPRFAGNPLVIEEPKIRFYAGAPIRLADGSAVGTLSVIDRRPRRLEPAQRAILASLAESAGAALENWRARRRQQEITLALHASEARLRRLHDATPALQIAVSAAGRVITVSDAWLRRFGYDRQEVVGRDADDFLTADSQARRHSVILPAFLATGECRDVPYEILHKDGTAVEVSLAAFLERDAAGAPLYSVSVMEDVTARRAAEAALAAERQRLEHIIEGTGAGTWEWNVQTSLMRINARVAQMLGRTLAEMQPLSVQRWREHLHPDDVVRASTVLEPHLAGETTQYQVEFRARHRDGHWVWLLGRGAVMRRTADGQPEWMFGTFLDITERKLQEEALRKSESFLERSGAVAGVGGWEFDVATGHITFSAQCCRIYGKEPPYSPSLDEAISFYPPESRAAVYDAVARATAGGEGWDLELPFIRAGGEQIWVRTVGSVEFLDGRPHRLYGAFQDVTRLVEKRLALEDAHERIAAAIETSRIGIWWWDIATGTIHWDDQVYRLYGITARDRDMTYEEWRPRVHPDDLAAAEQAGLDCISGARLDTEFRVLWPDGSVHHLRVAGRVTRDPAGRPLRVVGANWDITEPRRLAAELAEQHELLRVTMRSIGDAVITTDAAGRITWLNPVAERLTGWPAAEAVGQAPSQIFRILNESTRQPAQDPVAFCLEQNKVVALANHTLLVSRQGDEFGIEDSAAPIRNDRGETLGVVLVFRDVTTQRRLSGEMSYRASHDMLTGLVNRGEFDTRLRFLLHRAHADRSENALLYIDLDEFKLVNDACGHAAGDLLLQQVARLLAEVVRASDTLARLGGDEFAVILDHCPVDHARRLAQRICERMDDYRFTHDERRFRIGASIGLVPVDQRWSGTAAILQAADSACYAAKQAGRNRVHVWFDSDQAIRARHEETQLAARLTRALDEDRFVLFAQRLHRLRGADDGLHAEVLLRMLEGDGALAAPGAFLPAAERFHLAARIDRWVLGRAIAWMRAAPSLAGIATLSINLSGQSVGDRAFHRWSGELLAQASESICRRLCLEITEPAAVANLADAGAFIAQVRASGARVALDDFGAGASSFGYLKTMKVDFLKIDGQFIRDLMTDPLDEAAVRSFIDVAAVAGMQTVAECVEAPQVLHKLRLMGVDLAQGYHVHRPAPIEELLQPC